jgi:hypothetical protein
MGYIKCREMWKEPNQPQWTGTEKQLYELHCSAGDGEETREGII